MTWLIDIAMLDVTSLTAMFVGSRGTRWSCQWRIRKWILFEAVRCWFISPSVNCLYHAGGMLFGSEFSKVIFFRTFRSSHPKVFCKKVVLRNFTKFTGKHLCQSLFFNKVAGLRPACLLKWRLRYRCFPVNFAKLQRTTVLTEHLRATAS